MARHTWYTMKSTTQILIILSVLLTGIGTAHAEGGVLSVVEPNITIKYLGWDKNFNTARMQVNISALAPGKVVYIENYYSIDSSGQPKPYSYNRYELDVNSKKTSFNFHRPKDDRGQRFNLIEKYITINGQRTVSTWYDLHKSHK